MQKPKHILVLRFSAMGDVAMTVPVLRALLEQHPEIKITVVTRPKFVAVFSQIKGLRVFPADLKGDYKGLLGLYKLAKHLKQEGFDAVADLHNVLRTKILKRLLNIKVVQLDKGRSEKKALISGKAFRQLKSTHQRYAEVFHKLGLIIDLSKPSFPIPLELNQHLKRFVTNSELLKIGIAPFAAHSGKMYPLDLMRQVIQDLSRSYNIILFGGGAHETKLLNEFEVQFKKVTSTAGKLSLEEELILISNLDLMLSMDSANGHLAAIYGVKVVTIWGVTHPFAGFTAFHQPEDHALLPDRKIYPLIPTSVYGNTYPESYENVAGSIPPSEVIDKVRAVLYTSS